MLLTTVDIPGLLTTASTGPRAPGSSGWNDRCGPGRAGKFSENGYYNNDIHFGAPVGVACGVDGSVFVLDQDNNTVTKVTPGGTKLAHWAGGVSGTDQTLPQALALGPDGHVFVADLSAQAVQEFELQDLGPSTKAYGTATVKKGHTAKFKYEGLDDVSDKLAMTIKIYKGHTLKKTISLGSVSQGVRHTKSLKITLAQGSYTWKVYATDGAAHVQRNVAYKTLKVK